MKIINLYLKYQLTFFNIIVFSLIIIFLGFTCFISINDINESLSYEAVMSYYFESCTYYTKIILIFLVIFIFMKLHYERNEYLINIVIAAGYSKEKNFKMMILSNLIIIYSIIFISFIIFIIIGYVSKSYFYIKPNHLLFYFNMIVIVTYYGLLSYLICLLLKSQFLVIVVILLFLISELIINSNSKIKYLYLTIFPNVSNNTGILYINIVFTIILIILLYIISFKIYLNSDLKM